MSQDLPEQLDQPRARHWGGCWPGVVVDADDPLRRGRLRVRLGQVYGAADNPTGQRIDDSDLPWARPTFPSVGNGGDGVFDVPRVGAGVWVVFWDGNPEDPTWIGGFPGEGDVPDRVSSAYGPPGEGMQTRYVRTPGGQTLEMRWKLGEEEIRLQAPTAPPTPSSPTLPGATISIVHRPAERRIELTTATGQVVRLSDLPVPQVEVVSTGQVLVTGQGVNIASTGTAPSSMNGGGALSSTFVGAAALQYAAYALTALTTLALTATGAMTLTAATITFIATGAINIGVAGTFRRLIDERFAAFFDAHTHPETGGTTGPPTVPMTPSLNTLSTDNLRGN